jgi:hypothetical protein
MTLYNLYTLGRDYIYISQTELIKLEIKKYPFSNPGGTGWNPGICSYHEICVMMTKFRDEKLKFEKGHFYLWQ